MSFVHLHTHTPFSFLDGASDIENMVNKAAEMAMPAMAITDHNNVCAAIKFSKAAQKAGIKPIQGTEISLKGGCHLTLLARNSRAYASICTLLSTAHLNSPHNEAEVDFEELEKLEDVIVLSGCRQGELSSLILKARYSEACKRAEKYLALIGRENFYIELQRNLLPGDSYLNNYLLQLADYLNIETVATNNVHYACHDDFIIHDLLCCIRSLTTVQDINPLRPLNGENYIKSPLQMRELFSFHPRAIENSLRIAAECSPVFQENKIHFPHYDLPAGDNSFDFLHRLSFEGAIKRYKRLNHKTVQRLEYELSIIKQMGFADYFLLVWDLVRYAQQEGIRYAGRGSAADSLVAYCLYITEVDSLERDLLFERFMSPERKGLPDIDIDFESRHRNRIINYVYNNYGHDKVARVATYNTFKARSAIRDLGKALNFDEKDLGQIAKKIPHTYADNIRTCLDKLPELQDSPMKEERFNILLDACEKVAGFPRFLGMHLGGLVISDCPLNMLTPLQRSALGPVITQFDKDDIEDLGLVKLDLLSLRTLSVVNEASSYIAEKCSDFNYDDISLEDQASYEMIKEGETIGVFQLESPAQRALQSRLEASNMEDMIASMALIRPGPIKGNMVEPYIARRHGKEKVSYPHPLLEPILDKSYGVVLFQEQVIEIATQIAGFTPGEADQLRRVMTHARSQQVMDEIGKRFISRSIENGIEADTAREIFLYIAGYASYGFCEAHAAAFATTSFKTAYLIKHHPAEYYTALLNNQAMGYYPPGVICNEARRKDIKILPPDINRSKSKFCVENGNIRIGLKQIKGISQEELDSIIINRQKQNFISPLDFIKRSYIKQNTATNLINSGAFDSLCLNRRQMLTRLPAWMKTKKFSTTEEINLFDNEDSSSVPDFSPSQKRSMEYQILGMDIESHFMASIRKELSKKNICSSQDIKKMPDASTLKVAGLILRPHRPPTRSGKTTVFLSLEDEFGLSDFIVFEDVYMRYGRYIFGEQRAPLLIEGQLQKRGRGNSIIAHHMSFLNI